MGLNDEAEKVRQAKEWLNSGTLDQLTAACEYLQWRRESHLATEEDEC
jgi:hypothetical protein